MGRSALLADSQGNLRADRGSYLMFTCLPCRKRSEAIHHLPDQVQIRWHARKNQDARHVPEVCGPLSEEPGPQPSQGLPGSTVLPVAARRWVLAGNTFWHARWDTLRQLHQHLPSRWWKNQSRTKISLRSTRSDTMRSKLSSKPISSALSRGPVRMASSGKGFHPKASLMKSICRFIQRSAPEPCAKKSITWWLILCIATPRAWRTRSSALQCAWFRRS